MARPCTVCRHPEREAIEKAVASGQPATDVAKRFEVGHPSVLRHVNGHAPRVLAVAAEVLGHRDLVSGLGLAEEASDIQRRTMTILSTAEKAKELPLALSAIREARGNLELLGKLTGRIRPEVQVNVGVILGSPAWQTVEAALLDELEAVPGALEALERGMRRLGRGDA